MLIVKPFKGRYVSRHRANQVNDMLASSTRPDLTALKKEALEFETIMLQRRQEYMSHKNDDDKFIEA